MQFDHKAFKAGDLDGVLRDYEVAAVLGATREKSREPGAPVPFLWALIWIVIEVPGC